MHSLTIEDIAFLMYEARADRITRLAIIKTKKVLKKIDSTEDKDKIIGILEMEHLRNDLLS